MRLKRFTGFTGATGGYGRNQKPLNYEIETHLHLLPQQLDSHRRNQKPLNYEIETMIWWLRWIV